MLLAGSIFLLTLVLVIWQPRGLSIGWSASIGAVLALVSGVINLHDIPVVWNIVWNATAALSACCWMSLASLNGPRCMFLAGEEGRDVCCLPGLCCWVQPWRHCSLMMARR